jgi:hypothetical protein
MAFKSSNDGHKSYPAQLLTSSLAYTAHEAINLASELKK